MLDYISVDPHGSPHGQKRADQYQYISRIIKKHKKNLLVFLSQNRARHNGKASQKRFRLHPLSAFQLELPDCQKPVAGLYEQRILRYLKYLTACTI